MKQKPNDQFKMPKILYVCNPHKNTECTKKMCYLNKNADRFHLCESTSKIEHALLDIDGDPVVDFKYIDFVAGNDKAEWKKMKKQAGNNVALWIDREN